MSVAAPWSLSHYIPLNGFHPLYRALFENLPEYVTINAWDNVELSQTLRTNVELREKILGAIPAQREAFHNKMESTIGSQYIEEFFPPNIALTSLLSGDIEFHHTAPFPSLTRPFVFHCESFAPVFFPFVHQGEGSIGFSDEIRKHYLRVLGDPLCLGIFSHLPETLADISNFFNSPEINKKLHRTRIGLSRKSFPSKIPEKRWPLTMPRFLFVNSANQSPTGFFNRGGHITLRFWRELIASGYQGKLYLRCVRPSDELLSKYGVDIEFLHAEEKKSVIWIHEFLTNQELNALMSDVHFLLLPSLSLHSGSIMQAMMAGTVPIVSDTVGTSLYVENDHNGIVLQGVYSANWKEDPTTGVMVDSYHRSKALDDSLVGQLTQRITALLVDPNTFDAIRKNSLASASDQFSGSSFSDEFWAKVYSLYTEYIETKLQPDNKPTAELVELDQCMIRPKDWPRTFESVPHPLTRISSENGWVTELGGTFIYSQIITPKLHDWSVMTEHYTSGIPRIYSEIPRLYFARNIKSLDGRFVARAGGIIFESRARKFINRISELLVPFPLIHRFGSRLLKMVRRIRPETPESKIIEDIQLEGRNVSGLNVIRYFDKYFAIPLSEGEFTIEKVNKGEYRICFYGNTSDEVMAKIAEYDQDESENKANQQQEIFLELIEEGFCGLNIVRFLDQFYALPQNKGGFKYSWFLAGKYHESYCNKTLAAIKADITKDRK